MTHRGLRFGIFLAPFHRVGDNPTLATGRRGAGGSDGKVVAAVVIVVTMAAPSNGFGI
jgi:hypothetical protein